MGDEVATHPVHVDQCLNVDLLDQPEVVPLPFVVGRVDVLLPPRRLVGHLEGVEDLVVEAVLAHQALGHMGQEQTGLGPLDDPVVVGRGEGHRLADAQIGEGTGIGGLEPRREAEGPDADDQALPGHQPGYRLHGAQGPGIGQGHGGAGEVVGCDLVGVDLAHQLLVGPDEGAEIQGVGILDARHEERPGARGLLHVDGQTQAHVAVADHPGRALPVGVVHEGGVHGREGDQPLDHGVADQVGEADLPAGGPEQLVVHDDPVDLEQLGRRHPHAGRRGHPEGRLHVGHDPAGRTPEGGDRLELGTRRRGGGADRRRSGGGSRGGGERCGRGRHGCRGGGSRRCRTGRRHGQGRVGADRRAAGGRGRRRRRAGRAVVGEELAPRGGDRRGVVQEPVVHVLDQPGVGTERPCPRPGPRARGLPGSVSFVAAAHGPSAYWGAPWRSVRRSGPAARVPSGRTRGRCLWTRRWAAPRGSHPGHGPPTCRRAACGRSPATAGYLALAIFGAGA